jgi:RHS repeat-associated protein
LRRFNEPGPLRRRRALLARYRDWATGLYYHRSRWYDSHVGRFISEDPIGLEGGINPYVYAGNNPLDLTDPYGLFPVPLLTAIGGAVIGAAVGGYYHGWKGAAVGAVGGGLAGAGAGAAAVHMGWLPASVWGSRAVTATVGEVTLVGSSIEASGARECA